MITTEGLGESNRTKTLTLRHIIQSANDKLNVFDFCVGLLTEVLASKHWSALTVIRFYFNTSICDSSFKNIRTDQIPDGTFVLHIVDLTL